MNKKPAITHTETISRSRLFRIEKVGLKFENGEQREYERIFAPGHGAVMIIPLLDGEKVIMVREYAVGTDRYELVFPKGIMHEGDLSFTTHMGLAEDLYAQRLEGDEPERLETVEWDLGKLDALLQHPELSEARSIAALYMVRNHLEQRQNNE